MTLLDPKLYHDEDWIAAQVSQFHTILVNFIPYSFIQTK
jgi:hypothetical protein